MRFTALATSNIRFLKNFFLNVKIPQYYFIINYFIRLIPYSQPLTFQDLAVKRSLNQFMWKSYQQSQLKTER